MEAYNNNISIGFCWGFLRNQLTGSLLTSSKQLRKIFQRPFVFQFSQIKNVYLMLMVNILSEADIFINRFYIYLHRYCLMSLYSFFVFHHFIICKTKQKIWNWTCRFFFSCKWTPCQNNEFAWDALNEMAAKGCGLLIIHISIYTIINRVTQLTIYVGKYIYTNGLLF